MASEPIPCLPLKTLTDGPLFGAPNGTLSDLQNMNILPGGYAEARGGMEKLQPLGGTAADAISNGGYGVVHQSSTSFGWVRSTTGGGVSFGKNIQLSGGGWLPFETMAVGDALYFGADSPFSRIQVLPVVAAAWAAAVFEYEYWNGSNFNTDLTTQETIDWTQTTLQYGAWTMPTDWAANTVGDASTGRVLKYWMRIRVTSVTALATLPRVSTAFGFWNGMRELYAVTHSPLGGSTQGTFKRHGQNGTAEEWFTVASSLFSGVASPSRAASYRGRFFFVNSKEQKRWDGDVLSDIGLQAPNSAFVPVLAATAGAGLGNGIWRYYMAFGYGPPASTQIATTPAHDVAPSYGLSRATYIGEVTTAGANQQVTLTLDGTAGNLPDDASSLHIYRTQDLTAIATSAERATFPAFLIDSMRRVLAAPAGNAQNVAFTLTGTYIDLLPGPLFPNVEAINYDNLPPSNSKFIAVYQNRLLLGSDAAWYWSDAFQPDVFNRSINFIQLARATGGRHMGGLEFADQVVLWTEEQTWGLTNIDLDIPQLYPIHPTVGCVAPDAAASGDGLAIWPARDGFYAWNGGKGLPIKISTDMDQTFGSLSYETIGGSTATIHDQKYDIRIASPDNSTIGDAWRFDMQTGTWSKIVPAGFTSTLFPITSIHAPLGNRDPGGLHAVWAKRDYGLGAGDYSLFLEGLTTQDNGNNFTCSATMHFPVPPNRLFAPNRVLAYYSASDGWGTPTMSFATSSVIGSDVGALNPGTADTADDYSILGATFEQSNRGTSDLKVTFSVASAAGGTPMRQRFYGAIIEGVKKGLRRGMV